MLDADFLIEAKGNNEALVAYMTRARVLQIVDFLIIEPSFDDDANRCFLLPQLACECFSSEQMELFVNHLFDANELRAGKSLQVIDKLLSYFLAADPTYNKTAKHLNSTLGGYINKIISYWLKQKPEIILSYLAEANSRCDLIDSMFNHLYLSNCVTDLLVRFCTV